MAITRVRGYAAPQKEAVLKEIESIVETAPPFNARVDRSGCGMTNCGKYGWFGSLGYTKIHPTTSKRWPQIPPYSPLAKIWNWYVIANHSLVMAI